MSPTAVSLASGVPATTLRDNIQRLVERGLVERVPNPDDGRSYLLVADATTASHDGARRGRGAARGVPRARAAAPKPLRDYELVLEELNAALQGVVDAKP